MDERKRFFFEYVVFNVRSRLWKITLFFFILIVVLAGLASARYLSPLFGLFIGRFSKIFPEKIEQELLAQSKAPYSLFILWLVCSIGFRFVSVEEQWQIFLYQPLKVILAYSLLLLSWQVLDILEKLIVLKLEDNKEVKATNSGPITKHLLPYSKKILKILTTVVLVLIFLQNSGFNVTSLLASLGIGGIAIALAAKETLSNFFGGFTVIVDKPFSVGDWIVCNEVEGTVEDIGFRSTKVKTFYDSLLTIPNSVIANSIIDNLGKRQARRTRATLDITYDTSPEKIEAFVEGIKNIIKSNSCTRKDYYQCYFSDYGPHSLQILLNFFLRVKDWDSELLQKQNIFLEILRLAKELDLDFAFPTQTLDVSSLPGQAKKEKQEFSMDQLQKKAQSFSPDGSLSRPQGLGLYNPK